MGVVVVVVVVVDSDVVVLFQGALVFSVHMRSYIWIYL